MKKHINNIKTFEDYSSSYDKTDRDIDVDASDLVIDEPSTQDSEEDMANSKEYDNLHSAVEELLTNTSEQNKKHKQELISNTKDNGIDSVNLKGFTNENDIYDFYLEHRFEIDERLNDIEFFSDAPDKYSSKSLYDYIVQGTKVAIESLIVDME